MKDTITLTGVVATVPKHLVTAEGLLVTSFRLASSQSYYDRAKREWIDAETNWYTVSTYRELAANTAASVYKGDRVLVRGWLRIRPWENGDRHGTNIEVEASALGHDLGWGKAVFTRSMKSAKTSDIPGQSDVSGQEGMPPAESGVSSDAAPAVAVDDSGGEGLAVGAGREAEPVATPF